MNLQEMYKVLGEDYEEALMRIPKEKSLIRFLRIFATDGEFDKMVAAFDAKDYKTVFSSSHNIKGVCANLCLNQLAKASSAVCESVRGKDPTEDITPLVEKAKELYEATVDAISKLEE